MSITSEKEFTTLRNRVTQSNRVKDRNFSESYATIKKRKDDLAYRLELEKINKKYCEIL